MPRVKTTRPHRLQEEHRPHYPPPPIFWPRRRYCLGISKDNNGRGIQGRDASRSGKKVGVQLPQIYHNVGKMEQLADATSSYLWAGFLQEREENPDFIPALVDAIKRQILFGLTNSELYLHISAPRQDYSGQLIPDTTLSFFSAYVGGSPSLN